MTPLLDVSNLAVDLPSPRGPVPVIHDASLTVREGEIIGLAGESGSGKSLTAQAMLGLLPAGARTRGTADFSGRDLLTLDRRGWRQVRGTGIALVFQDATAALHPMLTVGTQITEHVRSHLEVGRAAARARAIELLAEVRIPQPERALRAYPHQFSGGMRQRVAIAIALACRPKLVIADEPTTGLDVTVQAGILALLERLRREHGLSVLFISHDLGVLAALTDRTYIMYAGRVMEVARTDDLLAEPRHPYTAALLAARPRHDAGAAMRPIPGSPVVPDRSSPAGCPFAPRCAHVQEDCSAAVPPLAPVGDERHSACPVAPDLSDSNIDEHERRHLTVEQGGP